ncbi:MAG: nitroreductase family protein [Acutalibacteraceae bacterium]
MLKDLVIANRSYRGYDESYKFTEKQLTDYVDLTRYTASSVNAQPLKYHIAYEKEEVSLIQSMTKWARGLPELKLPHDNMHPTGFIVICHDTDIAPNPDRFQKDIGIVAQTILLAAAQDGLGGCMIGNFVPEEVKEKLNFADNLQPMLIVALGKPAEKIVITEIENGESTKYYRDENDVHYVPKRKLSDIII